jgi:hypothetical protein
MNKENLIIFFGVILGIFIFYLLVAYVFWLISDPFNLIN